MNLKSPSAIFSLILLLSGCNSSGDSESLATAITIESQTAQGTLLKDIAITGGNIRIKAGDVHQLKATGTDENNDIRDISNELIWSSSNVNVATVNNQGLVTAVANSTDNQGIVIIRATSINQLYTETEVSINDTPVSGISLKQSLPVTGSINTCIDATISADILYEDGYQASNSIQELSFSLNENSNASISSSGILFTYGDIVEDITITANIGDLSDSLIVTSDPSNLRLIDIFIDNESTSIISMNVGDRLLVNAKAQLFSTPDDFHDIKGSVKWQQEHHEFSGLTTTGENKGSILALKPGFTQLDAICGAKKDVALLKVAGTAELEKIQINDGLDIISLKVGQSTSLTLSAMFSGTSNLNVSEFAQWSINASPLLKTELKAHGTEEAYLELTSVSNTTGVATISAAYDNNIVFLTVNIE